MIYLFHGEVVCKPRCQVYFLPFFIPNDLIIMEHEAETLVLLLLLVVLDLWV